MKLNNKHWGSIISIIIGGLFVVAPLSNAELNSSNTSLTGVIIILGSLAYWSRKKQILSHAKRLPIIEIITAITLILHIGFGISTQAWYDSPLNFTLVPLWILIAYTTLFFIKKEK